MLNVAWHPTTGHTHHLAPAEKTQEKDVLHRRHFLHGRLKHSGRGPGGGSGGATPLPRRSRLIHPHHTNHPIPSSRRGRTVGSGGLPQPPRAEPGGQGKDWLCRAQCHQRAYFRAGLRKMEAASRHSLCHTRLFSPLSPLAAIAGAILLQFLHSHPPPAQA